MSDRENVEAVRVLEMRSFPAAGSLLIALSAGVLSALQTQERCDVEIITTPGTVSHVTRLPGGGRRIDAGGGVEATCGDKWVRADSATWYDDRDIVYLFGDVRFRDPSRRLQSARATYFQAEDRVRAEGDVRLIDSESGSTLSGPVLDYYPAGPRRPIERMFTPRRSHLKYFPEERGEPFDVDADRFHIYGDSLLAGAGRVVAVREGLEATGDSLDMNLGPGHLWLLGNPEIIAEETTLKGDTILAMLDEGRIEEIQAWPGGSATGQGLELTAPILRLFVEAGEIVRTAAGPGDPERTGVVDTAGRAPWARSVSRDYSLIADSIDIRRPGGRLDRVIAVRRARARTLDPAVPEDGLLARDWIEGDTVTGFFTAPDTLAADTAEAELTRLVAVGAARALYHLRNQGSNGNPECPAVNYVIGMSITLWLEAGEVQNARVIGPATGLYNEPRPGACVVGDTLGMPPDSLPPDSAGAQKPAAADTSGGGR